MGVCSLSLGFYLRVVRHFCFVGRLLIYLRLVHLDPGDPHEDDSTD